MRRDHVGAQTSINRSDVHRDASLRIVESEELLNDEGELEDGARSLPRVEASMRSYAANADREASDTLACRLEVPVGAERRFENETSVRAAGEALDDAGRLAAPDLLVRVDQEHWRHGESVHACGSERFEREQALDQPSFHVVRPRPPEVPILGSDRHRFEGSNWPHRVAVPEDQLVRNEPRPLRGRCEQHAAAILSGDHPWTKAPLRERIRKQLEHGPLCAWIVRRGLCENQTLEELEHLRTRPFEMFEDSVR